MTAAYDTTPIPLRPDLGGALNRTHERLAQPRSWLDGAQRLAVAAEARNAWDCPLCQARKEALSPYGADGTQDSLGQIQAPWVDVIHRVVTDSGRLSARWYGEALDGGMVEDELIEVIPIAIQVTVVDCFNAGIGMKNPALPTAAPGKPARKHRQDAKTVPGWAASIAPEDAGPNFVDFCDNDSHFYIRRPLTLVPDETWRLWDLLNHLYLEDPWAFELDGLDRDMSRTQIEFLAARASALLGCYY